MRSRLSLKSRLTIVTITAAVISISIIGWLGYRSGEEALRSKIGDQLVGLRIARSRQIESYFAGITNHLRTLAEDKMVLDAARQFRRGVVELEQKAPDERELGTLKRFYEANVVPNLKAAGSDNVDWELLRPKTQAGTKLQHLYLATNPNPTGDKQLLVDPEDGSLFAQAHREYHVLFRNIVERFGFYDFLIINPETGSVDYSVYKQIEFGTSVLTGPHRGSHLARAVREVRDHPARGHIVFTDFEKYLPAGLAPTAFLTAALIDHGKPVAIIAIQVPVLEINKIMTDAGHWQRNGLGETGETYLVGDDFLMRSGSRFMIESPQEYLASLKDKSIKAEVIKDIETFGTTILIQKVRTEMMEAALSQDKSGTQLGMDYRGQKVLSSYAPLEIPGVHWAIAAEIDEVEAMAPIEQFARTVLTSALSIVIGATIFAMLISWWFLRPIDRLVEGARLVGSGKKNVRVDIKGKDEFGTLAASFNDMVGKLHDQAEASAKEINQLEEILNVLLPAQIVDGLKVGKTKADRFENVSVVLIEMHGVARGHKQSGDREILRRTHDLIDALDDAASRHDVEKIRCVGSRYLAVCGFPEPRVDHLHFILRFALEAQNIVQLFAQNRDIDIRFNAAITSGSVVVGIVGQSRPSLDVFGHPASEGRRIIAAVKGAQGVVIQADLKDQVAADFQVVELKLDDDQVVYQVTPAREDQV